MRIRSPSLPELHAFVHAARLSSFIKAAQSLDVTAGAISRSIARLEAHLGMSVFQRHSRGCVLTPQGRLYFESVAPAIDALEGAALMAQGLQAAGEGAALKLSVTPTLATHWLIRRLRDFYRQHPEVRQSFVPYHLDELPMVARHVDNDRGYCLCYPEAMRRSSALASFRAWLQAQGQEAAGVSSHAGASSLPGVPESDANLHSPRPLMHAPRFQRFS